MWGKTSGRVRGLVLAGVCATTVVAGGEAEWNGVAASPAQPRAERKPVVRGAADTKRAWLSAEFHGLTLHKIANRTDGSLAIDVRFRRDVLTIGIDASGGITVSRGNGSVRLTSAEAFDRLQRVLGGSDAVLAARAAGIGIPHNQISASAFCTRCDSDAFFSHRAGRRERQMGLLGIRNRA